jgi:hypothetical protein
MQISRTERASIFAALLRAPLLGDPLGDLLLEHDLR